MDELMLISIKQSVVITELNEAICSRGYSATVHG